MKAKKVRLTGIEKQQVIEYFNKRKQKKQIKYTFLGGVFGELHFWR